MARPRQPAPSRVRVRMYQVGFGDCFLVTFEYRRPLADGRRVRHVLIDFGSTHSPPGAPRGLLDQVAGHLLGHTDGLIDVVVATHRHKDHLEGFARDTELVRKLKPTLVVRPWTEDPRLEHDAKAPRGDPRNFAAMLDRSQEFAEFVAARAQPVDPRSLRARLAAAALDQVRNREAIATLDRWSRGGRGEYLAAGMPTRIEQIVPGIRVRVLGPPTLQEWPKLRESASENAEFWMLQRERAERALAASADVAPPVVDARGRPATVPLGPASWLVDRLRDQRLHSLLRIVRTVDDALNNTSLILLVDAGDKRLLFPGDAQIENWSYALQPKKRWRTLLAGVDLYKVGHHGSRNASPKSLFALWGRDPDGHAMTALMSTLPGVHGETPQTRVPRQTLVNALRRRAALYATSDLADGVGWVEVEAATRGGGFRQVPAR